MPGGEPRGRRPPRAAHLEAALARRARRAASSRAEARLRRELGPVAVAAQHAQQAAHLGERVAAGRPRSRRAPRRRAAAVAGGERARDRLGLDHHRAHAVRDHRLQLGGDPRALVLDRPVARSRRARRSACSAFSRSSRLEQRCGCAGRGPPAPGRPNRSTPRGGPSAARDRPRRPGRPSGRQSARRSAIQQRARRRRSGRSSRAGGARRRTARWCSSSGSRRASA